MTSAGRLFIAAWALGLAVFTRASLISVTTHDDRPITKVVKLLEEMLEKSKEDGEADRKIYAKFLCYCNSKKEEKNTEIADLTGVISLLENEIAALHASTGKVSVELAQLKADKEENQLAIATANATRTQDHTTFLALDADLTAAISQMIAALNILAEVGADQTLGSAADHKQFMAQVPAGLVAARATVKRAFLAASAFLPRKKAQVFQSFVQAPFTGTYTAQSGEVVGILKEMRDTFEANLDAARNKEAVDEQSFVDFVAAKTAEYEEMLAIETEKQNGVSANDASLAAKQGELTTATEDKVTREDFLTQLVPMCDKRAAEYSHRVTMRANEDAAITEAIAILNKDSAFATFMKVGATSTGGTGPATLLQYASVVKPHGRSADVSSSRQQAQRLLQKAARVQRSVRLIRIATLLQTGNPFDAVLTAIDKLIVLIDEEGQADSDKLSWCGAERTTSDQTVTNLGAEIVALQGTISTLMGDIDTPATGLKDRVAGTEVALSVNYDSQKSSTEQRVSENQAYQKEIKYLVEASGLLQTAVGVLHTYYAQVEAGMGITEAAVVLPGESEAHPETWEAEGGYKGQSTSGQSALEMLNYILTNTQEEEKNAHSDENSAQHFFEDAMQTLKTEEASLQQTLMDLKLELAETEKLLGEAQAELKTTEADKATTEAYLVDIKPGCDFITTNKGFRDGQRTSERAALEQAKTLLTQTPVYQQAVAQDHLMSLGVCQPVCVAQGEDHVICKACLAKVEVPGYCAGHPDTLGC